MMREIHFFNYVCGLVLLEEEGMLTWLASISFLNGVGLCMNNDSEVLRLKLLTYMFKLMNR